MFRIMKAVEETKYRVLVVDHNVLLLDGICTLIRLQSDMEIVGTAASSNEAVKLFREHRPKVVLMDLDLPESGGIVAIGEIHAIDPAIGIFGLFTHPSDECARLALRAGACGCVTKDRLNRDLVGLIRECLRAST